MLSGWVKYSGEHGVTSEIGHQQVVSCLSHLSLIWTVLYRACVALNKEKIICFLFNLNTLEKKLTMTKTVIA